MMGRLVEAHAAPRGGFPLILYGILAVVAGALLLGLLARPNRPTAPETPGPQQNTVHTGERDLGANINPSATGNQVNLWPDRTGAQTRYELGARDTTDMTFVGDRPEAKEPPR